MKKNTIIAIIIFSGLLIFMLFKMNQKVERGITRVSYTDLDTSMINRISITGTNSVELRNIDDVWRVGKTHEANQPAVEKVIQAISKIESSRLVTEDPKRYQELSVDEEKAVHLIAYAYRKKVADFYVGKSDQGGTYLRTDKSVYLVSGILPSVFSRESMQWYNLKLFNTSFDQVNRFEFIKDFETEFALVKEENTWRFAKPNVVPKGFRFDPMAAKSIVSALVNVRANRLVLDNVKLKEAGLEEKHKTLIFFTKDGQRNLLHLGTATQNNEVYAMVSGRDDIYLLNQSTVKNLDKKAIDLRDMKLVDLDIDKVVELSIRNEWKILTFKKTENEWKISRSAKPVPSDFPLDQQLITRRLGSMANTKAISLANGITLSQSGIIPAKNSITAKLDDATKVSIQFGSEVKHNNIEGFYAKGNIDKEYYLVSNHTHDTLLGLLSSFRKMPASRGMPNIDPKTLAKLPPDIRENLLRQLRQKAMQNKLIEAARKQQSNQTVKKPVTP